MTKTTLKRASNLTDETIERKQGISFLRCKLQFKQECIPVGCVPPAAVAVSWGGFSLSACWDTPPSPLGVGLEPPPLGVGLEPPQLWAWTPPQVWAWRLPHGQTPQPLPGCGPGDPPRPDLSTPPGCGLGAPLGQTPQAPPGCGPGNLQGMLGYPPSGDLQGMLGYHLQGMLGYHLPPVNRMTDRHV